MMKKLLFIASFLLVVSTTQAQITLNGQSTPATITQGQNISLSLTYTSTVVIEEWQIQLFRTKTDGSIDYTAASTMIYVGNNYTGSNPPITTTSLPIATTPTTLTFTSYCDPLYATVGSNYKWFVKLKKNALEPEGNAVLGDNNITVTVEATPLAVTNFDSLSSDVYVNSKLNSLFVNGNSDVTGNISIFTIDGKKVQTIKNIKANNSYDLSTLNAGIYILRTADNRSLKFVL